MKNEKNKKFFIGIVVIIIIFLILFLSGALKNIMPFSIGDGNQTAECNTSLDCRASSQSCFVYCDSGTCKEYTPSMIQEIQNEKPCNQAEWMPYPDCMWDTLSCLADCNISDDCLKGYYCDEDIGKCYECPSTYGSYTIIDSLMGITYSIEDCGYASQHSCVVNSECYHKFEDENYCVKWSCIKNECIRLSTIRYKGCCETNEDCESGICENHACISQVSDYTPNYEDESYYSDYQEIEQSTRTPKKVPFGIIVFLGIIVVGFIGYVILKIRKRKLKVIKK